jgi:FG-GAP-like repeat
LTRTVTQLLLLCAVAWPGAACAGDEDQRPPPAAPDFFMLYSPDAETIRVVPLVHGDLPDLEVGEVLTTTCGDRVDPDAPVRLTVMGDGGFVAFRGQAYARFLPNRMRDLVEVYAGSWSGGWRVAGVTDADGDGLQDLILIRREAPRGHTDYSFAVALGEPGGTFREPGVHFNLVRGQWNAVAGVGDVDGDGHADLVFHAQPHGGTVPATILAFAGRGDGTFAGEAETLVRGRAGMSNVVLGDFDHDGLADVFLPPDDDTSDLGQSYLALGSNGFQPQESLDFFPAIEGGSHDRGWHTAVATDVDLDGRLDLVVTWASWTDESWSVSVHRGDGLGGFAAGEELIAGAEHPIPTLAWLLH